MTLYFVDDVGKTWAAKIEVVGPFRPLKAVLLCSTSLAQATAVAFTMLGLWRRRELIFLILDRYLAGTEPLFKANVLSAQFAQLVRLLDGRIIAAFSDEVTLLRLTPGATC
jgi:hypothetical protein